MHALSSYREYAYFLSQMLYLLLLFISFNYFIYLFLISLFWWIFLYNVYSVIHIYEVYSYYARIITKWNIRCRLIIMDTICILFLYIEGILPKGHYPPCWRLTDRALLAGYPRYVKTWSVTHLRLESPLLKDHHYLNDNTPMWWQYGSKI